MISRGQVTLFIIIALVLLGIIGTTVYYTMEDTADEEAVRAALAPDTQPFYDYVTTCLAETGEAGIRRIGERGGYLERHYRAAQTPTQADGVPLSPDSDLILPYWYHMSSDDRCESDCRFTREQPALTGGPASIQGQITKYVETNIEDCLQRLQPFEEEGWEITIEDRPEVETTITEEGVQFLLTYPIQAARGEDELALNEYVKTLPVRLRDAYKLADTLTDHAIEYQYLDRAIYQLIALNQGLDANKLPPTYDVRVTTDTDVIWQYDKVRQKIKDLITSYVPVLQVAGTENYGYIDAPGDVQNKELFETLYNRNMLVVPDEVHDLNARFQYLPWWEPYLNLNCGSICQGENMMGTEIIPLSIQRYTFAYDVSVPILVQLHDPDAFNEKGFSFQFLLEANIRNSKPLQPEAEVYTATQAAPSQFCDPSQRTGRTLKLTTKDAATDEPIDAVAIYSCGSGALAKSCSLGNTPLEVRLPKCIGGRLSVRKGEYAGKTIALDSDRPGTHAFDLALEPYRTMDFRLKRYLLLKDRYGWRIDPTIRNLAIDEQAFLTLNKVDEPFTASATFFGAGKINEEQGQFRNISLLPGTYEVQITSVLVPQEPLIIPPQLREYDDEGFWVPPTPVEFNHTNQLPYGGARFQVSFSPKELDDHDTITFYTIDAGLDRLPENRRVIEDLEQVARVEDYSQSYRSYVEPYLT